MQGGRRLDIRVGIAALGVVAVGQDLQEGQFAGIDIVAAAVGSDAIDARPREQHVFELAVEIEGRIEKLRRRLGGQGLHHVEQAVAFGGRDAERRQVAVTAQFGQQQ